MSKYTTELRYICETEAGLDESKGYNDVNQIIELARPKIFNFSYPIYDESYKSVLETKILKHFYTREIGLETVGLWKLKLDTKMNEIMPYYNQLYKSTLLEFNPLWTDDYSRLYNKANDGNNLNVGNNETESTTINIGQDEEKTLGNNEVTSENVNIGQNEGIVTADNISRDKYADTPQGSLTDLEADKYLTNARKITEDNESTSKNTSIANNSGKEVTAEDSTRNKSSVNNGEAKTNSNMSNQNIFTNTEDYLEMVQGRHGKDSSELLLKYRKTFLNIDMKIIDDLEELFYHLW